MRKVAVVLSGCGRMDGSEISEAVLTFLELNRHNVACDTFAPDITFDVVNHISSESSGEKRSVLEESARIVRDGVKKLSDLNPDDYAALVMPGGFGVAKNLSNIATEKKSPTILPEMQQCVVAFHEQNKPIVAICISPALVAFSLSGKGVSVTLGPSDQASMIVVSGNKHIQCEASGCVVDAQNKIITTPAFMAQASLSEIHEGIHQAISTMARMLAQ